VIVVTVARKPMSEGTVAANVLEHGCGALNIDAARISTTPSEQAEMLQMSRGFAGRKMDRPEMMNYGYEGSMPVKTVSIPAGNGRWPANLVLGHKPGCQRLGTKLVKATSGIRPKDVGATYDFRKSGSMAGAMTPILASTHSDSEGNETIAAWDCQPDCPIAALDEQRGVLLPQGAPKQKNTKDSAWFGGEDADSTFYGDTGGASRFFKQFGGKL